MIYLDNAATTQVSGRVLEAMLPYFTDVYGNAGSIHSMGRQAAVAMQRARRQCGKSIGADARQIFFTSGGTEANNLALIGISSFLKSVGKTHIITTPVEHPSVVKTLDHLFLQGFDIQILPISSTGELDMEEVSRWIRPRTGLISVMAVNNETGNAYDIHQIGKICKANGVLFHTDCVQAFGNIDIDVVKDNIDFLSVSGHKIHAPKGVGFLYTSHRELMNPILNGGGQECELRSGTENIPSIVGLGEAAMAAYEDPDKKRKSFEKRETLLKDLRDGLGDVVVNGNPHMGSKTVNLLFEGVDAETLLLMLNNAGVCVSAGSACSAHSMRPSHVLIALGLTPEQARSSIRISFSDLTTIEEIHEAAHVIVSSVKQLTGR